MKYYLFIFFILLSCVVYGNSLEIEMSKYVGVGENVKGNISLSYNNSILNNEKIKVYLNNKLIREDMLVDLINKNEYEELEIVKGLDKSREKIVNKEKLIGVNLRSDIVVKSVSFVLEGGEGSVSVDVGDDKEIEWEYFGDFIGWSDDIKPVSSDLEEADGSVYISGGLEDYYVYYCERINLSKSLSFKVFAKYEEVLRGSELNGVIFDDELNKKGECVLSGSGDWKSCEIKLDKDIMDENFICVYAKGGSVRNTHFKLSIDLNENNSGFFCNKRGCFKQDVDYFIKVKAGIYDRDLNYGEEVRVEDLNESFNKFLRGCDESCFIPIRVLGDGDFKIKNFIVVYKWKAYELYNYDIYDILIDRSKIKLKDDVKVKLDDFNIKRGLGNYTLGVSFLNLRNESNFSVVNLPVVKIRIRGDRYVNETLEFDGSESFSDNKSVEEYIWEIGNIIKKGKVVSFVFDEEGVYDIKLEVIDSDKFSNSKKISFEIKSVDEYLKEKFNVKEELRKELIELRGKKDIMGFNSVIKDAIREIEGLEKEFKENKSSVWLIKYRLKDLLRSVPKDISIRKDINIYSFAVEKDIREVLSKLGSEEIDKLVYLNKKVQDEVDVKTNAKLIEVEYFNNERRMFTLITKEINPHRNLNNIKIIEKVDVDVELKSLDFEKVGTYLRSKFDSLKFGNLMRVVYFVEGDVLDKVGRFKTVVISSVSLVSKCGNSFCEKGEEKTCIEDCACFNRVKDYGEKGVDCGGNCKPCGIGFVWVALVIIVIVGVYFLVNLKKPVKKIVKKSRKIPFDNEKDLRNLEKYVKKALSKGVTKVAIRQVLLKKKWTREQINYVFKRVS